MADHVLEMAGLVLFCDFFHDQFFKKKVAKWIPQTISKVEDDFNVFNQLRIISAYNEHQFTQILFYEMDCFKCGFEY